MPIYRKKTQYKSKRSAPKPKTPFGDTGSIIGKRVGAMFGNSQVGGEAGRWLASGLGKVLFGSGDYNGNLSTVQVNSIINPQSTPRMESGLSSSEGDSIVITKTEYIKDIVSNPVANTFSTEVFALQPGNVAAFPFLSQISKNYEEYQVLGMVYHFKSLSGDSVASVQSGLGYVAMATQYDALDTSFINKSQIENYSMSQSAKPSCDQIHGIECKSHLNSLSHLYVRPGVQPANSDLRLYDMGKTTIATSCPGVSVTLGELWVSYQVKLFKPKISEFAPLVSSHHSRRSTATASLTFGLTPLQTVSTSGVALATSSSSLAWTGLDPGAKYLVNLNWTGSNYITTNAPIVIAAGTAQAYFCNTTTIDIIGVRESDAPANDTTQINNYVIKPDSTGAITLTTTAGVITAASNFGFDAFITTLESAIVS